MSKVKPKYNVVVRLHLEIDTQVSATDMESAIEAARKLKYSDLVTIDDDSAVNESDVSVVGVFRDYQEIKA